MDIDSTQIERNDAIIQNSHCLWILFSSLKNVPDKTSAEFFSGTFPQCPTYTFLNAVIQYFWSRVYDQLWSQLSMQIHTKITRSHDVHIGFISVKAPTRSAYNRWQNDLIPMIPYERLFGISLLKLNNISNKSPHVNGTLCYIYLLIREQFIHLWTKYSPSNHMLLVRFGELHS